MAQRQMYLCKAMIAAYMKGWQHSNACREEQASRKIYRQEQKL